MDVTEDQALDHRLVDAARRGDEKAFAQLVERYTQNVFATVVAVTNEFQIAPDITQETFLRAWFGLVRLGDANSFGPWIRTIARNRSRTWLSQRSRRPQNDGMQVEHIRDTGLSPEEETERAERERFVMKAFEQLSPNSREMLLLYYMEGVTTPQMATRLGMTDAAVRQRLRRARLKIQEEVEAMVANVISDITPGAELTDAVSNLLERARRLFGEVRYGSAVDVLQQARERTSEDTMVSLLLAEAYSFGLNPEQLKTDRNAYNQALSLFDEVLEKEPGNMFARLRRAALRSVMIPDEEIFEEQKEILSEARGSPFEAIAELEMARRYLARGRLDKAQMLYEELQVRYPWMACVLHSETGLCKVMAGDPDNAMVHFECAVNDTTQQAMTTLQETSRKLMGDTYWVFWSSVDNLSVRQCQNHAWLAGLSADADNMGKARRHLREALDFLAAKEVEEARSVLSREFVNRMVEMFPQLAAEAEIQSLKREIEKEG